MINSWSIKHSCCVSCNSTRLRHMAKGLCVYCYSKSYSTKEENLERIKEQKQDHYLNKQKKQAKAKRDAEHFDGLRELVLIRDKYCCQKCGTDGTSSTLIVHHKDGQGRGHSNPNNTLENLITECRACHIDEHRPLLLSKKFKRGISGWAKDYDRCIDCNTTEIKHYSHGRCVNCRAKFIRSKKI